jgi:putative ABC transport system substrate-binding protein
VITRYLQVVLMTAMVFSLTQVGAAETAQKIVRVGFVGTTSPSTFPRSISAFWDRLRELGYVEGRNLIIESRWAEGRLDRLPALMAEMVERKVDVIVTWGTPAAFAARNATNTIPIVDTGMGDPVGSGLAASLARPGGNITGFSAGWADIRGKWLELLQEAVPRLATVAIIANPDNALNRKEAQELESMVPLRGLKLLIIYVREAQALDHAVRQARRGAQALLVFSDPLTMSNTQRIVALAARHRLPDMYLLRDSVQAGGLMAYGPDLAVVFRRSADYVDKILNGARPADLPIEQPTQYRLVVNLKTAKALGITIPQSILVRAEEVIR